MFKNRLYQMVVVIGLINVCCFITSNLCEMYIIYVKCTFLVFAKQITMTSGYSSTLSGFMKCKTKNKTL